LKIDEDDQLPAVQTAFREADVQARPIVQELTQLRLRMLNLELSGSADEMSAVLSSFTTAAARMTTLEVQTLNRVSSELKSNQRSRRREAFEVIGGIFYPPPPPAPRARRSGSSGGGVQ
jgi:hypothetical protein